jgi:hypothetical protein
MKKLLSCLLLLLLTGCAANPAKLSQIAREESSRMMPASESLSAFSSFELQPMGTSEEVASDPAKTGQVKLLEQKLRNELLPLFESWEEKGDGIGRKLLVQPTLIHLRIISGGSRFWVGGMAGDSQIDMDLKLTEAETSKVIALSRINLLAGGMAGGWSVGATDRNLLDYVVATTKQYLEDNYEKR